MKTRKDWEKEIRAQERGMREQGIGVLLPLTKEEKEVIEVNRSHLWDGWVDNDKLPLNKKRR